MTGIGAAVIGHLDIPTSQLLEFKTTALSKARIIGNLCLYLESQELKWSHKACPTLTLEMRGYQEPDDYCQTDCVISLAIALDCAAQAHESTGRILGVIEF